MSLDGLVTRALSHELQMLVGGRIHKIHQPTAHDIVLQIRAQGQNLKLLLSANPTYPRVHLTEQSFQNPLEAPMFCMLFRKHFESGIIEGVDQIGLERILRFHVRQRDELGDISVKTIVVELMGRHSNIILLEPAEQKILDGIHHITPAISIHRVVLPGFAYVSPPEQGKRNPLQATAAEVEGLLAEDTDPSPEQKLVALYSGISPLVAKEIVYRYKSGASSVAEAFVTAMKDIEANRYIPVIAADENTDKSYFSVLRLTHVNGPVHEYGTPSQCMEAYYGDKAERDTVKQRVSDLIKHLQNEKNKNLKKREKLRETVEEAKEADKYRIQGELLMASLHLVQKGQNKVEVINYYDEEQKPIHIALDPMLSPSENAQRYFKKYNKMKNSLSIVTDQITATEEEIVYLDTLLQQLSIASLADVDEIREELAEQGYVKDRSKKQKRKNKSGKPSVLCYTSSEGIPMYVGKNNTQNDYVSNRLAAPSDTWLHTKDIPGSHVVIRSNAFGDPTLEEAAMLAAFYSQARESSLVPVDYTLIRHVRKPNGAKPGFVIYDHQKTLFITPDESRIKQLKVETK